jgi:hypothetical protein
MHLMHLTCFRKAVKIRNEFFTLNGELILEKIYNQEL